MFPSNRVLSALTLGAILFGAVGVTEGAAVNVPNFSFENPALSDGGFNSSVPSGWISTGINQVDSIGAQNWQNAQFSNTTQVGGLDGSIASPGNGFQSIYVNARISEFGAETNQLESAGSLTTVDASTIYTLTAAVGKRFDFTGGQGISRLVLLVNGIAAATSEPITEAQLIAGAFKDFSVSFTTLESDPLIGGNLTVRLQETATSSNTQQVNFDNVRLDATLVPEPAMVAALGLAGLLGLRRSRSRMI